MNFDTINDGMTMAGGAGGALLANRYRIVRQLGQGGMGSVWLAEDTQLDGKLFAIKMLPSILVSNKRAYRQLKDEALVAMRLVHPNIVQLRAFEENNGNPFLVMDYIDGETLDDYLAERGNDLTQGRRDAEYAEVRDGEAAALRDDGRARTPGAPQSTYLPESEVLRILKPIAATLDYAHGEGVVHRDVKPANVMIRKDGHPYILDFGIAREIQETMTRVTGKLSSGTLLYMSPEQLNGDSPKPAQDVYSFAAMAYECLKGEPPFSRGNVEFQIMNKQPEPLTGKAAILAAGVMSGLSKKPEDRPASCAAVLEGKVLSRVEHGERVDGNASRRGAETQMKIGAGKVLAVLALSAVIGVGGLFYHQSRERRQAERSRLEAESAAAAKAAAEKTEAEKKAEEARRAEEARKLEDARRKLEEEKRAIEAEKARMEKERAKSKTADNPSDAGISIAEQEARRKEIAELAEIRVDIAIKEESIAETMGKIAAYRNEPDGFAAHIANAYAQRKIADGVGRSPATSAEAQAALKTLEDAERVIQREYNWLKTNKTARDEAKQLDVEIDRDIVPLLERFKAGDYARVAYGKGDRLRKDGNAAISKGDFPAAKAKLSEAMKQLAAAATEAQRFCIDTHLKTAKKWSAASKWLQCVEECDTILGWDAANAEAKRLKAEAEKHLVPTAKVIVKVNGSELKDGETVRIGSTEWKTPIVWGAKNITKGSRYGGEVAYEKNGRRYFGRLDDFTIDWPGPRTFTVALREYTGPKHGDVKTLTLPGSAKMEMIYVGPGTFTMGSPTSEEGHADDETQHRVTLTKGFWLGKYEVTQKQWLSVMGSNPSRFKGDDLPVESVSWNDCQEFVKKANDAARRQFGGAARLPTEAEWEYACRAGTSGAYAGTGRLDDMGWYWDYIGSKTHPVGQKRPNAWGFYDMHGNVYEWCSDRRGSYEGDTTNPIGSASGDSRVLRGGGWFGGARDCRSADRFGDNPGNRSYNYGFRLCCSAGPRETEEAAQRAEAERREREAREAAERERRAKWRQEGAAFTINDPYGLNLTMKWCPAGTFTMGSPTTEEGRYDDERRHQVTLSKGFWVGETEVTQGQWKKLMDGETIVDLARKGLRDDNVYNIAGKRQTLREFCGMSRDGDPMDLCGDQKDDVPVYNVSWNEAVEFCRRLTQRERAAGRIPDGYEYRLPTETEWEYACRAGTTAALPNGRDIRILGANNAPALDDISWYAGNSSVGFDGRGWDTSGWPEKQYPGGRACARDGRGKKANRWGLYDMIGNVWEWCGDWYGDYPYGSVSDPAGATTGAYRVNRGGGWFDIARDCRSARRGKCEPGFRGNVLGFRVALAPSH